MGYRKISTTIPADFENSYLELLQLKYTNIPTSQGGVYGYVDGGNRGNPAYVEIFINNDELPEYYGYFGIAGVFLDFENDNTYRIPIKLVNGTIMINIFHPLVY